MRRVSDFDKVEVEVSPPVSCGFGLRYLWNDQRGDRSPQIPPLHPPMGSGGTPETPRTKWYLRYIVIKNADVF